MRFGKGALLLMVITIIAACLINIGKQNARIEKSTAEQLKTVQVGDFIRYQEIWLPVKRILGEKEDLMVAVSYLNNEMMLLKESFSIDSVISKESNHTTWDSLAVEYCIHH